jgi:hypothetical protein
LKDRGIVKKLRATWGDVELTIEFSPGTWEVRHHKYSGPNECVHSLKKSHFDEYAIFKGETAMTGFAFVEAEFSAGRGKDFSDWIEDNVPTEFSDLGFGD